MQTPSERLARARQLRQRADVLFAAALEGRDVLNAARLCQALSRGVDPHPLIATTRGHAFGLASAAADLCRRDRGWLAPMF